MRLKPVLLILLLLGFGSALAQTVLDGYVKTALENNAGLRAARERLEATREAVSATGALPDPRVGAASFLKPIETRTGPQQAKLSLTQTFPWFGTLKAQRRAAEKRAEAERHAWLDARAALVRDVKRVYYDLYENARSRDVMGEAIDLMEIMKQLAEAKIETGRTSSVNALKIDMELTEMAGRLNDLTDRHRILTTRFQELLNAPESPAVVLPDTLAHDTTVPSADSIWARILRANHRLTRQKQLAQAAESRESLARKRAWPSLSLGVDYWLIGEGDMPDADGRDAVVLPRVGLNLPLNRKKYGAMKRQAVRERAAMEHGVQAVVNALRSQFEDEYARHDRALRDLDRNRRLLDMAARARRILETETASGKGRFEDLLDLERRMLNYALAQERARSDLKKSRAGLDFMMGGDYE